MNSSIPCLGFASRSEAVRALREQGLNTAAIAEKIGITPKQVNSLEAGLRHNARRKTGVGRGNGPTPIAMEQISGTSSAVYDLFPHHQRELVRAHAARRTVTCARLIQMIVEKVVADDLVDAVLDDGAAGSGARS